jgi:hypothetical protein
MTMAASHFGEEFSFGAFEQNAEDGSAERKSELRKSDLKLHSEKI